MNSTDRRSMAALILAWLVIWTIPVAVSQEQQPEPVIGVDVEELPTAAPNQRIPAPPVPVDLVPMCRICGTLDGLVRLKDRCVQLAGSNSPIENSEMLEMISTMQEQFRADGATDSGNGHFLLDVFLAVPVDGSTETELAYGFSYPFGRAQLLKMAGDEPEFAAKLEAAEEGYAVLDDVQVLVREQRCAFLAMESPMTVDNGRVILDQLLKDSEAHRSSAVAELIFEPRKSVHKLRKPFLDATLSAFYMDLQRRDGEDELEFRLRDVQGKSVAALIDLLLNQIEQLRFAMLTEDGTENVRWDLQIKAVAGSDLDGWMKQQEKCRNRVIRELHPDHAAYVSFSLAIPEVLQTLLRTLGQSLCDRLISENVITAGGGRQLSEAIRQLTGAGTFELLLQSTAAADGEVSVIATLPFAEPADISNAAIELISYTKDSRWQMHWIEIDGTPVHRFSSFAPGEFFDLNQSTTDLCFLMTDSRLVLQLAPPNATSVLAAVVRQEFPEPELAPRLSRSGLSLKFRLRDGLRLTDTESTAAEEQLYGRKLARDEQPQDQISVTMLHDPHTITLRATFERDATVAGVTSFMYLLLMLMQELN